MFVNLSDEDTGQITITENAELRTGPLPILLFIK